MTGRLSQAPAHAPLIDVCAPVHVQLMVRTMNVNCFGIYRMTKAFFPLLKEENEKLKAAGEGTCSIVNMTSMAGTSRLSGGLTVSGLFDARTTRQARTTRTHHHLLSLSCVACRSHCPAAGGCLLHLKARGGGPQCCASQGAEPLWHPGVCHRGTPTLGPFFLLPLQTSSSDLSVDPIVCGLWLRSRPSPTRPSWWPQDSDRSTQRYVMMGAGG